MNKELELEIANHIFLDNEFTLEDLEREKVFLCIDATMSGLTDKEVIELIYCCYEKFGEGREHFVSVFRKDEGFYITTDEDEALALNEKNWVSNFCYHITKIDECVKKYDEFISDDVEYEYFIELSQH